MCSEKFNRSKVLIHAYVTIFLKQIKISNIDTLLICDHLAGFIKVVDGTPDNTNMKYRFQD